ncbi:hypothetical protein CEXT_431261 [Caerostris extrusa]|uniref:Uncharacterized protein n=1 Tax=Caerostris extrusa TaxID=172846 RepID=A0AAV4XGL6_CAEEX|nr:hypothetical protein CEXT_431261 [Caerostris extrusa]
MQTNFVEADHKDQQPIQNQFSLYNYSVKVPKSVIIGAETFALLNSALNPVFYGYFNVRVRKGFIEIVYRKKEFNRDRVCNGMSGETSYSSTILQQMENRGGPTQMVIEMSEFNYRGSQWWALLQD